MYLELTTQCNAESSEIPVQEDITEYFELDLEEGEIYEGNITLDVDEGELMEVESELFRMD